MSLVGDPLSKTVVAEGAMYVAVKAADAKLVTGGAMLVVVDLATKVLIADDLLFMLIVVEPDSKKLGVETALTIVVEPTDIELFAEEDEADEFGRTSSDIITDGMLFAVELLSTELVVE